VSSVRRGSDWLDGAVAGWLAVSAVQAAGAVGRGGAPGAILAVGTAAVLAGAIVPYLRFTPIGWRMAAAGLAVHLLASAARTEWDDAPRAAAGLLPHLLTLGYLAYARGDFHPDTASAAAPGAAPAAPAPQARRERAETVDAGIPLQGGERCLAVREVELYRVPAGASAAPGRFASVDAPRDLAGHTRAGSCRLVLTDRRVVLVAPSGQQSPLPLDRVAHAAVHLDGVAVRPGRGPALFLRFHDSVGDFAARLSRALSASTPPDGS
jgi:hypothetical protein